MRLDDTIAAISTPPGRGGIGVVRLSGSGSRRIASSILRFRKSHEWRAWSAALADLLDESGEVIDHVVATFYEAPRSYTAEDVVEIACHGSPVVLRHCLERAVHAGARLAEPGEFTLRAYLHGRLDLPQAEAVRDLIESTTLYQARVAAQQVDGAVSRRVAPLKAQLIELVALLEAGIDFAEDDISVAPDEEILRRLGPLLTGVGALAGSFAYGKLVHSGLTLAIAGRPNVGKSSLFNRLLDQNRAIVSDVPGTTRDTVSETAAVAGIPVRYVDTAGIRQGQDRIEEMGIERSLEAIAGADLTLVVIDGSQPVEPEDEAVLERARAAGRTLVVFNKSDLPTAPSRSRLSKAAIGQSRDREGAVRPLRVSALTGEGVDELRRRIVEEIAPAGGQEAGFITSLRHEAVLRECVAALAQAERAVREHIPHEMLLLDLYEALRALDALTGATTADDILNRIFATFCIGK